MPESQYYVLKLKSTQLNTTHQLSKCLCIAAQITRNNMSEVDAKRADPFISTFDAVYTQNLQVFKEDFHDNPGWQETWAAQCRIWSKETADQRQAAKLDPLLLRLTLAGAYMCYGSMRGGNTLSYASCFRVVFCSPSPFRAACGLSGIELINCMEWAS